MFRTLPRENCRRPEGFNSNEGHYLPVRHVSDIVRWATRACIPFYPQRSLQHVFPCDDRNAYRRRPSISRNAGVDTVKERNFLRRRGVTFRR